MLSTIYKITCPNVNNRICLKVADMCIMGVIFEGVQHVNKYETATKTTK